jgi:hypothetical protein
VATQGAGVKSSNNTILECLIVAKPNATTKTNHSINESKWWTAIWINCQLL